MIYWLILTPCQPMLSYFMHRDFKNCKDYIFIFTYFAQGYMITMITRIPSTILKLLFDPYMRPRQILPLQVRVDLGVIAIKSNSTTSETQNWNLISQFISIYLSIYVLYIYYIYNNIYNIYCSFIIYNCLPTCLPVSFAQTKVLFFPSSLLISFDSLDHLCNNKNKA